MRGERIEGERLGCGVPALKKGYGFKRSGFGSRQEFGVRIALDRPAPGPVELYSA
jgi:hypothetical protein